MSEEPGQLAYEKSRPSWLWCEISVSERKIWAAVEVAVRADEREKVLEEAELRVDELLTPYDSAEYQQGIIDASKVIRALIEKPAAPYEGEK